MLCSTTCLAPPASPLLAPHLQDALHRLHHNIQHLLHARLPLPVWQSRRDQRNALYQLRGRMGEGGRQGAA